MGPSRPDFLCVFLADNRELSANKQEAQGRAGGRQGGGLAEPWAGVGELSPGTSNSEAARD